MSSDGGKGSGRRVEDLEKIRSNWDLIDWGHDKKKAEEVTKTAQKVMGELIDKLEEQGVHVCSDDICGCTQLYDLKD